METTKKTPMEDRAKKIRKESKHLPQKKPPAKHKGTKEEKKDKTATRQT